MQDVERADEGRNEPGTRRIVDFEGRTDLLDPAIVHDDDAVGHRQRFLLVVGHIDGGDAEVALHRPDLLAQGHADLGIESRERLVEQQHLGLDGQRAGEGDALLLPAGELIGVAAAEIGQLDEPQHLGDPRGDLRRRLARHLQAECDVVGYRHVGEQRVGLEYHADLALVGAQVGNVAAVDADAAGRRRLEAGDHAQRRGLAAAARPEEGYELAPRNREIEVLHRGLRGEALAELFYVQKRHVRRLSPPIACRRPCGPRAASAPCMPRSR